MDSLSTKLPRFFFFSYHLNSVCVGICVHILLVFLISDLSFFYVSFCSIQQVVCQAKNFVPICKQLKNIYIFPVKP